MQNKNNESLAEYAAQRQVDAYNDKDIDAFLDCYSDDIELTYQHSGEVFCKGKVEMRAIYGSMFNRCPDLLCIIVKRIACGEFAIDEELVNGQVNGKTIHATAIYHVNQNGLIDKAWFMRDE